MNSMSRVGACAKLSIATKLRVYQTCVVPVLMYGSDTWTLLISDMQRLHAFQMQCQRRIFSIKWYDHVRNIEVASLTGLEPMSTIVSAQRSSLFGHIVRLATDTPANRTLSTVVSMGHGDQNRSFDGKVIKSFLQINVKL